MCYMCTSSYPHMYSIHTKHTWNAISARRISHNAFVIGDLTKWCQNNGVALNFNLWFSRP